MPSLDRRAFLRACTRSVVPIAETALIIAGGYVLFRQGYRRILTAGVEDRRFASEASLPDLPQEAIPFAQLADGETLLGKRIRLQQPPNGTIDVEAGFVSTPAGRDLRLRISPTHTFRSTDQFRDDTLISASILDVTREQRDRIRVSSLHGAALLSIQDCADVARRLRASADREIVIPGVPYELRSPFRKSGTVDLSFERLQSL